MTPNEAQQLRAMAQQYVAADPRRASLDGDRLILKKQGFSETKVGWIVLAILAVIFFVGSIAYAVRLISEGYGNGEMDLLALSPWLLVAVGIIAAYSYYRRADRTIIHLGSGEVTKKNALGSKPVTNLSKAYKVTRFGERVALVPVTAIGLVHYWVDEGGTWKSRSFEYGTFKNVSELQRLEPLFSALVWCFNPAARTPQAPNQQAPGQP